MADRQRVALVTGAASGIGRAAAELLAAGGAAVAVVDLDAEGGRETVTRIEAEGGEAWFLAADVADERSVEAMVAEVVGRYGRLDAALNNAGISDASTPGSAFPPSAGSG